jgi:hypothetical protein
MLSSAASVSAALPSSPFCLVPGVFAQEASFLQRLQRKSILFDYLNVVFDTNLASTEASPAEGNILFTQGSGFDPGTTGASPVGTEGRFGRN